MMHRNIKPFFNIFDLRFKIALFIFSFLYVCLLFFLALREFKTDDPLPNIKEIQPSMRKSYQDLSTKVRAGLFVKNFSTFDFTTNHFTVDAIIWFEFNKNEIMQKTVDKFSFDNGKILHKSTPHVSIHHDKVLVTYDVIFEAKTDLDFHHFPFEDHRLSLVLTNNTVAPSEMFFDDTSDAISLSVSNKLFTSNWLVHSLYTESGYTVLRIDEHNKRTVLRTPKAVFTINFEKAGVNKILIIFVPLFAAIFLALLTFLLSFNSTSAKTTLSVTAVTALLGYRFVIQQLSPPVGYFTTTDKIFIFFIGLSFFIMLFQLLLLRQYLFIMDREKIKKSEQPETDTAIYPPRITEHVNSLVYFGTVLIFIIVLTYLMR
jgi:hypothetical protein